MTVNELMIGDWVRFKNSDLSHRVCAIKGKSIKVDKGNWYSAQSFEPIPLTEGILLACGFEKRFHDRSKCIIFDPQNDEVTDITYNYHSATVSVNALPYIDVNKENEREQKVEALHCRYVHELQHILRCCNTGNEIIV